MNYIKLPENSPIVTKAKSIASLYSIDYYNKTDGFQLPGVIVSDIYMNPEIIDLEIIFSSDLVISLPICNQENLILETLTNLYLNCYSESVLVIVLDFCQDSSGDKVREFLACIEFTKHIHSVIILETSGDYFESNSENLALNLVKGRYFLSLQADIMYTDIDFITRCIKLIESNSQLLAISSRAVLFENPINPKLLTKVAANFFRGINWLLGKFFKLKILPPYFLAHEYFGDISTPPHNKMFFTKNQLNKLYVGDVLIRGPIFWDSHKLRSLGNLNDVHYFLGGDEKEACRIGTEDYSFFVGYMPSSCFSNVWTGSSHNPQKRTDETIQMLEKRKDLGNKFPSRPIGARNCTEGSIKKTKRNHVIKVD